MTKTVFDTLRAWLCGSKRSTRAHGRWAAFLWWGSDETQRIPVTQQESEWVVQGRMAFWWSDCHRCGACARAHLSRPCGPPRDFAPPSARQSILNWITWHMRCWKQDRKGQCGVVTLFSRIRMCWFDTMWCASPSILCLWPTGTKCWRTSWTSNLRPACRLNSTWSVCESGCTTTHEYAKHRHTCTVTGTCATSHEGAHSVESTYSDASAEQVQNRNLVHRAHSCGRVASLESVCLLRISSRCHCAMASQHDLAGTTAVQWHQLVERQQCAAFRGREVRVQRNCWNPGT